MASSYTSRILLELQADGENPNSWGDILNNNVIQLVDDAVAAYTSVTLSSTDYTLTTNDGSTDQARSAMLEIVGTVSSDSNLIIPGVSKFYIIKDRSVRQNDAAIKVKTVEGSGFTVAASATRVVICDSVSVYGTDSLGATVCVTNLFAQTGNFTACVSTTNLVAATGSFTTSVCAATGSFSACVSTTNLVAATGSFTTKVSGVAAEFSGAVCAAEFYGDGSNLTNVGGTGTLANSNFTRDTTAVSATTNFPMTRAPAVDEGTETVTCTITPTNSSNLLRITATTNLQKSASSTYAIMGLFRDTDSWAFASQWFGVGDSATPVAGTIMAQVTAGSTSSTVFKLRMATNTGHWASNVGLAGTALAGETLGGTVGNTMLVEEIKV